MKTLLKIILLFFLAFTHSLSFSESVVIANQKTKEFSTTQNESRKTKILRLLKKKFTNSKGKAISIGFTKPIDLTTNKIGKYVISTIKKLLISFGDLKINEINYMLESITLEEMRKAMAKFKVDVLILTVLKDTNFDLYIYDKRTPYNIYAHSEALPQIAKLNLTKELAETEGKLLIRRTLYRYMYNQFFELPRHEATPFLRAEIPRWIASVESLKEVNREIKSYFYGGAQTGAAFVYGRKSLIWNSSVLGAFIGINPIDKFSVEFAVDSSAYNTFVASIKYTFSSKATPFKIQPGLGWSYVTAEKVWVVDDTFGLRKQSYHIVPSISLLFPIGKAYLKLEHRTYIGLDEKKFMFTLMPGIFMHF